LSFIDLCQITEAIPIVNGTSNFMGHWFFASMLGLDKYIVSAYIALLNSYAVSEVLDILDIWHIDKGIAYVRNRTDRF
jgi:hypothetical protein